MVAANVTWVVEAKVTSQIRALSFAMLSAAMCCWVAACGPRGDAGGGNDAAGGPANPGNPSSPATASSASIDACALISAEDITKLLGTSVPGKSTSTNPEVPACSWENPETYESVSLEIGNPGTAVNNTLPPSPIEGAGKPGPDGMRYGGGGQVEFAAGNRDNSVQVAVNKLSADEANAAAVDLARKVSPKIPN